MPDAKFKAIMDEMAKMREERGLDLDGKKYSQVKDRIEIFRREFGGDYGIATTIDYKQGFHPGAVVVARTEITDETGVVATGHAMDIVGSSDFTSAAVIESVETASVGRALAFMGFAGGEFPSGTEMTSFQRKRETYNEVPPTDPRSEYRREQQALPVERRDMVRRYVPVIDASLDLNDAAKRVSDEVVLIEEVPELTAYWHEIRDFREVLMNHDTHLLAELKACFAVRKEQIVHNQGERR